MKSLISTFTELGHCLHTKESIKQFSCFSNSPILAHFTPNLLKYSIIDVKC